MSLHVAGDTINAAVNGISERGFAEDDMCLGDLGDVDVACIRKTVDDFLREIDDDAARKRFWFLPFSVAWRVLLPRGPCTLHARVSVAGSANASPTAKAAKRLCIVL